MQHYILCTHRTQYNTEGLNFKFMLLFLLALSVRTNRRPKTRWVNRTGLDSVWTRLHRTWWVGWSRWALPKNCCCCCAAGVDWGRLESKANRTNVTGWQRYGRIWHRANALEVGSLSRRQHGVTKMAQKQDTIQGNKDRQKQDKHESKPAHSQITN